MAPNVSATTSLPVAIAGLILSLIATQCGFTPLAAFGLFISIPLSIAGISLGAIGRESQFSGKAMAGFIVGIAGLMVPAIWLIVICLAASQNTSNNLLR